MALRRSLRNSYGGVLMEEEIGSTKVTSRLTFIILNS